MRPGTLLNDPARLLAFRLGAEGLVGCWDRANRIVGLLGRCAANLLLRVGGGSLAEHEAPVPRRWSSPICPSARGRPSIPSEVIAIFSQQHRRRSRPVRPHRGHAATRRPDVTAMLVDARDDLLAFTAFPIEHGRKLWSTNPLERLHTGRSSAASMSLACSPTTPPSRPGWSPPSSSRQHDEWAVAERRYLSETSIALTPPDTTPITLHSTTSPQTTRRLNPPTITPGRRSTSPPPRGT